MSAADPAQAFGQQSPPSPIVAHHLLLHHHLLLLPIPNCKLPACTSCTLACLKKNQTNRSVQKCIHKVSYKIMGGKNNKEASPWPTVQVHNKKGCKGSRTSPTKPTMPVKAVAMRHEVHPGTEETGFLRASWSHCPQVEAIYRHTNCFRKLKYLCSYNLALISLFESYRRLAGNLFGMVF